MQLNKGNRHIFLVVKLEKGNFSDKLSKSAFVRMFEYEFAFYIVYICIYFNSSIKTFIMFTARTLSVKVQDILNADILFPH